MKITIAYIPGEDGEAANLADFLRLHFNLKMHESERHPPFKHIYLYSKKPKKPDV